MRSGVTVFVVIVYALIRIIVSSLKLGLSCGLWIGIIFVGMIAIAVIARLCG